MGSTRGAVSVDDAQDAEPGGRYFARLNSEWPGKQVKASSALDDGVVLR